MTRVMIILVSLLFTAAFCHAEEKNQLSDKKARDSYSLGYEFGNTLKMQEVDVDENILISAIQEALKGKEPAMSIEDIRQNLKQLRKQVLIQYNIRKNAHSAKNKKDGETFLAANKNKEGIIVLTSGLQYKVLKEGSGPIPLASDLVRVNYRGTLLNGMEFDNTYTSGEPATVKISEMIPGWVEVLPIMKTGSKWQIFVPTEQAYGDRQFGKIPPNSMLIYELELVSIEKDEDAIIKELESVSKSTGGNAKTTQGKPSNKP